ncbi:MAG TPA: cation:proton antiporter [bacterium]|nr:cation:proton antiporter [bacterium]
MNIFIGISLILVIATVVAGILQKLKQPVIIGYILTGLIIGPYLVATAHVNDTVSIFSEFGVAILLFIIGLSLKPMVLKEVGRISLVTGLGQVVFTTVLGFALGLILGYSIIVSLYIAVALTFSSTIIIMKLLSDKGDANRLYGKISTGFLIVQDVVAAVILFLVSIFSNSSSISEMAVDMLVKAIFLAVLLLIAGKYLVPPVSRFFAKTSENLFIFSLGFGFGMASLFHWLGFSAEIGALIAGMFLASTPFSIEIASRLKPLRDFFIILFFISLGARMELVGLGEHLLPALLFSAFILIGNPLIVILLMGMFGYKKKIGFQAGLTVAQISEFSLILIILGIKVGHLPQETLSLVTLVGLMTITGSTYLIMYSEKIYPHLASILSIFERKNALKKEPTKKEFDTILIGCNRIGLDLLESLRRGNGHLLVIDFDPNIIERLSKNGGIETLYGDVEDYEFLEEIDWSSVRMVISTISDFNTDIALLSRLREKGVGAIIMTLAQNSEEAISLYESGASYVVTPHFLGGKHASMLISKYGFDVKRFLEEKEKHLKDLHERRSSQLTFSVERN